MNIRTLIAGAVVLLSAAYLLGFGTIAVVAPARAGSYLTRFAGSVRLHVLELVVRFAVGLAFVGYASHMQFGRAFGAFGAVLLVTTLALALLRWHRRFAETSVPAALPYLPLIGIVSIIAGAGVVWAVASILIG